MDIDIFYLPVVATVDSSGKLLEAISWIFVGVLVVVGVVWVALSVEPELVPNKTQLKIVVLQYYHNIIKHIYQTPNINYLLSFCDSHCL